MKKAGITRALTVAVNDRKAYIVVMNLFIMLCFLGVIGTTSSLRASQSDEILSPESGYVDLRYRSDDKVVALTYQSEFSPDKFQYEKGETVKVRFEIKVDPTSRGYKPNRQYYLLSPYVKGYQVDADFEMCWTIINSNIDTLKIVTDDSPFAGELEMQLMHYRNSHKQKSFDNGQTFIYEPKVNTKEKRFENSGPPNLCFKAFRISLEANDNPAILEYNKSFRYDQNSEINFYGKVWRAKRNERFKYDSESSKPKNDSYLPSQPGFKEIRGGRLTTDTIRVLANTSLEWNIAGGGLVGYNITSVSITGNSLGCSVVKDPTSDTKYILTTGNQLGSITVQIHYTYYGSPQVRSHNHRIVSYYNFSGQVKYNNADSSSDYQMAPFIGKVILWGKNTNEELFTQIDDVDLEANESGSFSFSNISIPIIQIGFYAENATIPVLYYEGYDQEVGNVYYQYRNGVGFYHPESLPLCSSQLNFFAYYKIMLIGGTTPYENVDIEDIDDGIIRFKDAMSCGAINIAAQMNRLHDYFDNYYGISLDLSVSDYVVFLDKDDDGTGNAYSRSGWGEFNGSSAVSIRGRSIDNEKTSCWSNSAILHELTHLIHDKLLGVTINSTENWVWAGGVQTQVSDLMRFQAFIEGMAFYIPCLVQRYSTHMFWDAPEGEYYKFITYDGHVYSPFQVVNLETGQVDASNVYPKCDYYAGTVACILWDLSDGSDDTSTPFNCDELDFSKEDVFSKISFNSPTGSPRKLCQFLNRMWTSSLLTEPLIRSQFLNLCSSRSIGLSDFQDYKLSAGTNGIYEHISDAINASCDGEYIIVEPGIYEEDLVVDKSISLEGKSANSTDAIVNGLIEIEDNLDVSIRNISVTNPMGNGFSIGDAYTSLNNVNIVNNYETGILCSNPEKMILSSCTINSNGSNGIESTGGVSQNIDEWGILSNCLVANNQNYGIYSPTYLTMNNCTISNNQTGINDVTHNIVNSILYYNEVNIDDTSSEPIIRYSCVEGGYAGLGNISANPRFANTSVGDYRLLWDINGPSPCIDAGISGINNLLLDIDGTKPDMGYVYYPHAVRSHKFDRASGSISTYWQCFPVVDNITSLNGECWDELGYLFRNNILFNPQPQLSSVDWWYDGIQGSMEYLNNQWTERTRRVSQSQGYKINMNSPQVVDSIYIMGFRADPETTSAAWVVYNNGIRQGNWVGYFLPNTQNAWDSLSKRVPNDPYNRTYLDYIYQIKARTWGASRIKPKVGSPWILEQDEYTLSEGDMVVIELMAGAPDEMFWKVTPELQQFIRVNPSSFSYEEKPDYKQFYIQFDPENMPDEVGIYVNNTCVGAAVVGRELEQINLYLDDTKDDEILNIVFYYGSKGKVPAQYYTVFNNERMVFESTSLTVSDIQDYAYISFKDPDGTSISPLVTSLEQNYPNPFNPSTSISFTLSKDMPVTIELFNLKGQKVKSLVHNDYTVGKHQVIWDGKDDNNQAVGSGIYIYKLKADGIQMVRRMTLLK